MRIVVKDRKVFTQDREKVRVGDVHTLVKVPLQLKQFMRQELEWRRHGLTHGTCTVIEDSCRQKRTHQQALSVDDSARPPTEGKSVMLASMILCASETYYVGLTKKMQDAVFEILNMN